MEQAIAEWADKLHVPEIVVIGVLIFLLIWVISWIFLPFSVWSISSKVSALSSTLDRLLEGVRECAGGLDGLKERVDRLASKD